MQTLSPHRDLLIRICILRSSYDSYAHWSLRNTALGVFHLSLMGRNCCFFWKNTVLSIELAKFLQGHLYPRKVWPVCSMWFIGIYITRVIWSTSNRVTSSSVIYKNTLCWLIDVPDKVGSRLLTINNSTGSLSSLVSCLHFSDLRVRIPKQAPLRLSRWWLTRMHKFGGIFSGREKKKNLSQVWFTISMSKPVVCFPNHRAFKNESRGRGGGGPWIVTPRKWT